MHKNIFFLWKRGSENLFSLFFKKRTIKISKEKSHENRQNEINFVFEIFVIDISIEVEQSKYWNIEFRQLYYQVWLIAPLKIAILYNRNIFGSLNTKIFNCSISRHYEKWLWARVINVIFFSGCDQLQHLERPSLQPSDADVSPVARSKASLWAQFLKQRRRRSFRCCNAQGFRCEF